MRKAVTHVAPPTFVLERRINESTARVNLALSTRDSVVDPCTVSLAGDGVLSFDTPLRCTLGSYDLAWRTKGRLRTRRGRLVARVELTVDAWSSDATRLQIRPASHHPERWGRWRLNRYFRLAHVAADRIAREIQDCARVPQLRPVPEHVGIN